MDFEVRYVSSEVQSAPETLALKLHGDFYFFHLMFVFSYCFIQTSSFIDLSSAFLHISECEQRNPSLLNPNTDDCDDNNSVWLQMEALKA